MVQLYLGNLEHSVKNNSYNAEEEGNYMTIPVLANSYIIVKTQSEAGDRIFLYNSSSVIADFQRVRTAIGMTLPKVS